VAPILVFLDLGLAYSEDFGAALRANTLSRGAFVLHSDSFRILDLNLLSALHTICLHSAYLLFADTINQPAHNVNIQVLGFTKIKPVQRRKPLML